MFRLIVLHLLRNRRRTFLTIFSISLSIVLFITFVALQRTIRAILDAAATSPRLVCHDAAGLAYFLPKAYEQKLVALPHVEAVAAWSYFGGVYRTPSDQITAFASDPDDLAELFPDWGITPEMERQFLSTRTAAIVSDDLTRRYGWQVGQMIILRSGITALYRKPLSFTITGTLPASGPSQLFIFRNDYLEQVNGRVPPVSYFWIRIDRLENASRVITNIDLQFDNSASRTQTETERSYVGGLLRRWDAILLVMEAVSITSLLSIALVAANTAAMSIRERRSEIAVLRAIGFQTRRIFALLMIESWIVGILGGLVGCFASAIVLASITRFLPVAEVNVRLSTAAMVESLLAASLIGLASGFFPTMSAARTNIADSLRSF